MKLTEQDDIKAYLTTFEHVTYQQQFRKLSKTEGKPMVKLAVRLTDLLQQWTKGCKMMEEICDVLVKEHLQSSLPTDVWIHVSEKKPKTSAEVVELADSYPSTRRRGSEMSLPLVDHGKKPLSGQGIRGITVKEPKGGASPATL